MLFRVELRTDDPKLIEVLTEVRNKAKFVKKALKHYISTKRGKETIRIMSSRDHEDRVPKPENSISSASDNRKKSGYDLDRFL